MDTLELSPFLDGLKFGEAPRWHDGRLSLSDVQAGRVLAVDDDGQFEVIVETGGPYPRAGQSHHSPARGVQFSVAATR
jgi:sugar lactone lactonase YvrE